MGDTQSANKLVQGVGYNDKSCAALTYEGKITKEYQLWTSILERCYNKKFLEKNPTYLGCTVSEEFKHYHLFHAWCQKQVGFGKEGYQLDKDILVEGNKEYSSNTCCFVPRALNSLLKKPTRDLPVGVTRYKDKFQARCSVNGIRKCLGTYNTIELAFAAYAVVKEAYIKAQAEHYKDYIDFRIYEVLMNYKVKM